MFELIVTLDAVAAADGPVLPAESETPFCARVKTTVPSEVQTTVTVIDEPDSALGVKAQPVAVPELLKSPEAMPLTDSLNVNVYESVRDDDGELGSVHVAVGFTVSIVTLVAVAADDGPEFVAVSETAPDASLATTVPSEVQTTVTVIDEPDAALGVKAQPVAVPELLKSPETIPLTDSLNASVYESVRDDEGEPGAVHVAVGAVES